MQTFYVNTLRHLTS